MLLFIGLLNSPVAVYINHKPSKMCSNLLLLLRPECEAGSSEAAAGLCTDKRWPGVVSSVSGWKTPKTLSCFHGLTQISHEYRRGWFDAEFTMVWPGSKWLPCSVALHSLLKAWICDLSYCHPEFTTTALFSQSEELASCYRLTITIPSANLALHDYIK